MSKGRRENPPYTEPPRVCRDCKHYFALGEGEGQCRRYPPRIVIGVGPKVTFGKVSENCTCGEWAALPSMMPK